MKYLLLTVALALIALPAVADDAKTKAAKKDAPRPELGAVAWIRDHDAGFAEAKRAKKPVFLLFQEVPG